MKISHRIAAAVCGTSCMTAFSYGVSSLSGRQFREPVLLSHLLSPVPKEPALYSLKKMTAAWILHFGVGQLFSLALKTAMVEGNKREVAVRGLLFGTAFACIGISGWALAFKLHSNPPAVDKKSYLFHLLPAHLVFGSTAALAARYFLKND